MSGAFDAKVDISTADAVQNLRALKAEVRENAAEFRDFNKAIQESKQNVVLAAQQMTKLAQARRQNAAATKDELANTLNSARATAIKTTADAKAGEIAARRANQEAQAARAVAQTDAAIARKEATQGREARAAARSAASNKELTDNLSNTRYLMYDVGATLGVLTTATLALPAASAAAAASYERDFAQVLRVTEDLTNGGLDLRNQIMDLGRDIPLAFGDMTKVTQLGAQMGIANNQLEDFTETTTKFVAVTGIAAETSSQLFGRLETSFNPDGKIPDFFNKVGASIAYVGAQTVATDPEIASMMNQIGSLGAAEGMTAQQTIGLAAALASVRVQPELARGTLTRIFGQINRDIAEGSPRLAEYGKLLGGLTSGQAAELWKSDPSQFFTKVIEGLHGIQERGGNLTGTLDALGVKASRDVSALTKLAVGWDVLDKSMKAADEGFTKGTFLDESSAKIFDTLIAKLQKMVNSWTNLAARVGGPILEFLKPLVDAAAGFANTLDTMAQKAPALHALLTVLMGLAAVTGVFLGLKTAQAFVLAGLISFQQMAGSKGVTAAMSLSGVLKELGRTFMMVTGQSRAAAGGIAATAAAANTATAAAGRANAGFAATAATMGGKALGAARSFGAGLLSLAGGPIGVALIALATLGGEMFNTAAKAEAAGKAIALAMKQGTDAAVEEAAKQLTEIQVSWADGIAFGNVNKNMRQIAEESGLSFDRVVEAASKGKNAVAEFDKYLQEVAAKQGKNYAPGDEGALFGLKDGGKLVWLRNKLRDVGNQAQTAADDGDAVSAALEKMGIKAADSAGNFDDAGNSVKSFEQKLEELNDTIFGTLDAESKLQGSLQKIGEGLYNSGDFSPNTEGGRANISNLEAGIRDAQAYYNQLKEQNVLTAQEAATGYANFVDQLMNEIRSKGGDPSMVADLANQTKAAFANALGSGEPASVPVVADTQGAKDSGTQAVQAIQQLATGANASVAIGVDANGAALTLEYLAQQLSIVTGYPYQVVLDALTDPASKKSKEIYELLTQITNQTYTAPVNADTSAAIANIRNFSNYARNELASVQNLANNFSGIMSSLGIGGTDKIASGLIEKYKGMLIGGSAAPAPAQVATPTTSGYSGPTMPSLGGVADGYNKVKEAADKAGKSAKDLADGIDDAARAAEDYGNRLKTGLDAAFERQYGLTKATDDYRSALNEITKKRQEELKQVSDLRDRVKELNNERNKDLVDARKAQIEANISKKYGETDRAMDYQNQAQTALDNAAAKQKDIDASKKQADTIQAGIGKLTGYSEAAIANRAALRDLESKMLSMVSAYAATGASQEQVRAYAMKLTGQFQKDSTQLGYNRTAVANLQGSMQRYIGVVNAVPRVKPTTVTANTGGAMGAIRGVQNALNGLQNKQIYVRASYMGGLRPIPGKTVANGQQVYQVVNPDGTIGKNQVYNRGGYVEGYASGGLIPGTPPQNPRVDNLMAQVDGKRMIRVRSREFIQPQEAVDYYGLDFMNAIRTMSLPRFNGGGSPGGYSGGGGSGASGGATLVELTAENIQTLLRLLDRPVELWADAERLASTVQEGNTILASKGVSIG